MIAVAMGVLFIGYTGGLWGYCLIRGYNVGLGQLINPVHQFQWKSPMPLAGDTVIFPSGAPADARTVSLAVVGGQVTPRTTGATPASRPGGPQDVGAAPTSTGA